jgi:hypothetical protein
MHFITDSGIKKIVRAAVETGKWTIENGKKHHKLRHIQSGACLPLAKSTSDVRAYRNIECDIRKVEAGTHKFCFKKRAPTGAFFIFTSS